MLLIRSEICWSVWLSQSVENMIFDPEAMRLSPTLAIELKKKKENIF